MSPHHFSYLRNIEIEPSSRYFLLASFCRCMMRTSLLTQSRNAADIIFRFTAIHLFTNHC
jgi:hypothetical protein